MDAEDDGVPFQREFPKPRTSKAGALNGMQSVFFLEPAIADAIDRLSKGKSLDDETSKLD